MIKPLYILLGIISLVLGIIGVFVPGLPTTPFLLLAMTLFARSSYKLYKWLINHKYLGAYISKYRKRGITGKTLVYALALMWVMITLSVVFFIDIAWLKILIVSIGLLGSMVMYGIYRKKGSSTKVQKSIRKN